MLSLVRPAVYSSPESASADKYADEQRIAGAQWFLTPGPARNDLFLRSRVSSAAMFDFRVGYLPRDGQSSDLPILPAVADHVAAAGDCFAFRVYAYDNDGEREAGVSLMPLDRRQPVLTSGGHGVVRPHRWNAPDDYPGPGPFIVVPGVRNGVALVAFGLPALAVTNPSDIPAFTAILARMFADCDPNQPIYFVGPKPRASRAARALKAALPGRLVRWSLPPQGYTSAQAWADARLAVMTEEETLDELWSWFHYGLVLHAAGKPAADDEPDLVLEDADLASFDPPGLDPDGPGAQALLPPAPVVEDPAPEFRPYLSPIALARAEFPSDAEIRLAHRAHMAAVKGRQDEVARLVAEGDALSRSIEDVRRLFREAERAGDELDDARKALADAPEEERTTGGRLRRDSERRKAALEAAFDAVGAAELILRIRSGWRPERENAAGGGVTAVTRPATAGLSTTPAAPGQGIKAHNPKASPAAPQDDWAKIILDLLSSACWASTPTSPSSCTPAAAARPRPSPTSATSATATCTKSPGRSPGCTSTPARTRSRTRSRWRTSPWPSPTRPASARSKRRRRGARAAGS